MSDILNQKTRTFFDDIDLFKQSTKTFESINSTTKENEIWNLEKNINISSGNNSIFHLYYDNLHSSSYLEHNLNNDDEFTYEIIVCESGTEVFEKYNSTTEYQPTSKKIYVFIEKKDNKKSNLFGTACRVKMGNDREILMRNLLNGNTTISVENNNSKATNLKQWTEHIAKKSKGQESEIDADVLLNAVKLELVNKSDFNQMLQTILGLNNKLADWMKSGVEAMEEWKFTEENYEYVKFYVEPSYNKFNGFNNNKATYKPIIPVQIPHPIYADMANSKNIAATGLSSLLTLAEKFDEIAMGIVYNIVKATPTIADDFFYAVVFYLKNYLEDYVLGSFKEIFKKIKELISLAINFLKDITAKTADFISEQLAILNAFLCGLLNGIISLFQTILVVLAFVVDNISILELENVTKTEISKHQEKLEFVEDLIDLISENATALFSGLVTMFTTTKILNETIKFIDEVWKKSVNSIKNTSKYFWAYFIGAVVFELILDAVIAFFTGGASLAVKASAKITRLATKAEELANKGIKIGRQFGKKVAENASDLYKWLKDEFLELIEAIKSGNFIKWIKKKFYELTGDVTALRKMAYDDFIKAISKSNLDEIIQHTFEGDFGITRRGKQKFFSAKGMHSIFGVNKRLIRIIEDTEIPPKLFHGPDTFFKAKPRLKYKNGQWVDKMDNGGYSSFFPSSWTKDRIMEEIAFAWKNKEILNQDKGLYRGLTTTGQELIICIKNGEIKTVFPLLD